MIVQRIAPHLRDIHVPAPLRDKPLWCTWRYETYSGEPKPRKGPFYADGMRRHGQQSPRPSLGRTPASGSFWRLGR